MKKCRYVPEGQLPPQASDAQIESILLAISIRQIRISGKAERMVRYCKQMSIAAFVESIRAHVQSGYRIFEKTVQQPPAGYLLFEANVSLNPGSNDEDDDVYVEIRLSGDRVYVHICDSHDHYTWQPRLPK